MTQPRDAGTELDRVRRRVLWTMPSGLYVLGARARERVNGMTCNWASQVASTPKLLGVAVQADAYTLELIRQGGGFSLNILAREDRAVVRKFVKPAEVDLARATLNGIGFHAELTGAPVLDAALAWLDCRLEREVDLGSHVLVVGEILGAAFQRPEETPVLRMEDTRMSYGG